MAGAAELQRSGGRDRHRRPVRSVFQVKRPIPQGIDAE